MPASVHRLACPMGDPKASSLCIVTTAERWRSLLGLLAYACHLSTLEAKAGGLP